MPTRAPPYTSARAQRASTQWKCFLLVQKKKVQILTHLPAHWGLRSVSLRAAQGSSGSRLLQLAEAAAAGVAQEEAASVAA
jgi:hypothetical protein